MTVTQRLLLTFSLLSASLVALVIVMGVVLSGFQSRFQYVQEKSVPSIVALDELIANSKGLTIGYIGITTLEALVGFHQLKTLLMADSTS